MKITTEIKSKVKQLLAELNLWGNLVLGKLTPHKHYKESFFLGLANSLPRSHKSDQKLRSRLLAKAGVQIDPSVTVWAPVDIRPLGAASRIKIGRGGFINSGVSFACQGPATISIGDRVMIGPRCSFETQNHTLVFQGNIRPGIPASITIEDDVWLAARVTVLPGVRVGKGSVVAAGAVVTKDVPPYTLVGGVPARVIKKIELEKSKS